MRSPAILEATEGLLLRIEKEMEALMGFKHKPFMDLSI